MYPTIEISQVNLLTWLHFSCMLPHELVSVLCPHKSVIIAKAIANAQTVAALTGACRAERLPAYLAIDLISFLTACIGNTAHVGKILRDEPILSFASHVGLLPAVSMIVVAHGRVRTVRIIRCGMVAMGGVVGRVCTNCVRWGGMEWLRRGFLRAVLWSLGEV